MQDKEKALSDITLAPYIFKAMALIGVPRRAGSNMFRHQLNTLAILLDYKLVDAVLLKASVIHDLFEELGDEPWVTREAIASIDADGPAVYDLVMEVTIRKAGGVSEPKTEYLRRIMLTGSDRAKKLKLADRISNLITLGFVTDRAFVERYTAQTRDCILPYSEADAAGEDHRDGVAPFHRPAPRARREREHHQVRLRRPATLHRVVLGE